jgi:hypothetical protein
MLEFEAWRSTTGHDHQGCTPLLTSTEARVSEGLITRLPASGLGVRFPRGAQPLTSGNVDRKIKAPGCCPTRRGYRPGHGHFPGRPRKRPDRVLADKAYSHPSTRSAVRAGVATRYAKCAAYYRSELIIASLVLWLRMDLQDTA